jgi:1-acyl-sn-glycerol-3-phosphate acyltransferase
MDQESRPVPLTAEEIERRFRSVPVVVTRPLVRGGLKTLSVFRRFGWTSVGATELLDLEPPLVFAANHLSHVDTAAIMDTLPRPIRSRTAVAAALDVFGPSSTGRSLRNDAMQLIVAAGFHAFAFDRHGPPLRSIRTSTQLIRQGWNLLLYPEGTRSRTGKMAPFKAGVGLLARYTRRPVVPIHVSGGRDVLPNGTFLPRPARMIVRYGSPMRIHDGESPLEFSLRVQRQVFMLGGLPVPPEPAGDPATVLSPEP